MSFGELIYGGLDVLCIIAGVVSLAFAGISLYWKKANANRFPDNQAAQEKINKDLAMAYKIFIKAAKFFLPLGALMFLLRLLF